MTSPAETAALVVRAQSGEAEAFTALARAFLPPAYAVALAIVNRSSDAEDVAQDAFVTALEKLSTCRQPDRFAGWLLQIVRNRALNHLDRRRLRDVTATGEEATGTVEALRPEHIGLRERLVAALTHVTPTQREVVLLHDLEEWTHAEIAAALGISEVMSRQHLFNARRVLRAQLGPTAVSAEVPPQGGALQAGGSQVGRTQAGHAQGGHAQGDHAQAGHAQAGEPEAGRQRAGPSCAAGQSGPR